MTFIAQAHLDGYSLVRHTSGVTTNHCPHDAHPAQDPVRGGHVSGSTTSREPLPHPRYRVPLLGDLLRLSPSKPTQNELALARELGPIYELQIGPKQKVTVVTGADLVAEVNDEKRFQKFVAPPHIKMRDIAGDGLFTAFNREPNWAVAHEILQPGFTKAAMQRYHSAMIDSVGALFSHWDKSSDAQQLRDVSADMNALTFEVIGRAGFSQSFGAFDPARREFIERLNGAMHWMSTSVNAFPLVRSLMHLRYGKQYQRDVAWLNTYAAEIATSRNGDRADGREPDLLDLMLESKTESGETLDANNIANQVNTFLLAGNETTAGAMGFAMHYMAQNPRLADEVVAEVEAVVSAGGDIRYADVPKLRLTRRVIDETLRLWPPAPAYFRRAREDVTLADKYFVPQGGAVMVLILGLHRTPQWGANVDDFDPSRFERLTTRGAAHPYKPFGTGPRACIGRQFALHEMVLALAMILNRYKLIPEPGYQLTVSEQLTLKPKDLRLRVERR